MSFSSGCIILFTLALRVFLKRRLPVELFCVLWWLAIIRALVPYSITSDFSVYNLQKLAETGSQDLARLIRGNEATLMDIAVKVSMIIIPIVAVFFLAFFWKASRSCDREVRASEILKDIGGRFDEFNSYCYTKDEPHKGESSYDKFRRLRLANDAQPLRRHTLDKPGEFGGHTDVQAEDKARKGEFTNDNPGKFRNPTDGFTKEKSDEDMKTNDGVSYNSPACSAKSTEDEPFLGEGVRCGINANSPVNAATLNNPLIGDEIAYEKLRRLKDIRIRVSKTLDMPVSYGLFNPCIILPESFDTEDKTSMAYILMHEYVHIIQRHFLWKIILIITLCVHWFNPMMWLMYHFFEKDVEILCDKYVLNKLGESHKEQYAHTIINMAREQNEKSNVVYNSFAAKSIEERIIAIMKFKKMSLASAIISLGILMGASTVFATTDSFVSTNEIDRNINVKSIDKNEGMDVHQDVSEVISVEISSEEFEELINESDNSFEKAASSLYIESYEYSTNDIPPKSITMTATHERRTYKGTLYLDGYVYVTATKKYTGYYSGTIYRQ